MKYLILLTVVICHAGCTTLRPVDGTLDELRSRISAGELLEAGDRVVIVTTDERTHKFRVRRVADGVIEGAADRVRVNHLASLEKREFSRAKTLSLVGGAIMFVGLSVYAVSQVAVVGALQ
jgi:hypothetical protein